MDKLRQNYQQSFKIKVLYSKPLFPNKYKNIPWTNESYDSYENRYDDMVPLYDRRNKEVPLTVTQKRIYDWLRSQLSVLFRRVIQAELKMGYNHIDPKNEKEIIDYMTEHFIILFKFDCDKHGEYLELWVSGYAYQILYKRNRGEFKQWLRIGNYFHKKFRKTFNCPLLKHQGNRLRAYYKPIVEVVE